MEYYSKKFWEDHTKFLNQKYKSYIFFINIGKKFNIPNGYKVQLGVGASGHTLKAMKEHWGHDQVLGFDLFNLSNDPCVQTIDIKNLKAEIPCAYIENDIGNSGIPEGKTDRWVATQWAIKNLVPNGILISNDDHVINYPIRKLAEDNNCRIKPVSDFDNEDWAIYLNEETVWKTKGWIIIIKN